MKVWPIEKPLKNEHIAVYGPDNHLRLTGGQILTERVPPNGSLRVAVPVAFLGDPETLTVTTSASLPASAIIGQ